MGNGLLMCGAPGLGKPTLSVHLIHAGFQYGGDDVVLITPDGQPEGLPFPPTVKSGAWEMISKLRSEKRFIALKKLLADSQSFELSYSDAAGAARKLTELCHGNP